MGDMTSKTNLEAARSLAQTSTRKSAASAAGIAELAARMATVLHGFAGLRFSLTKGMGDDELCA